MMSFATLIADVSDPLNNLTNLGVAGLMGAMWLWERRTSQKREQQIDESHARIISDGVQIDQLMGVVRQNAEAITRLAATQDQLLRQMSSIERSKS